jgi:hypothetical protein
MKVAEHRIVGAMVAPQGKAAFDRGTVVIASRDEVSHDGAANGPNPPAPAEPTRYFQVRAYLGTDDVEGKPLEADDWRALVRAEQGIALPPVDAASGAAFWILRSVFDGRDAAVAELRTSQALLHDVVRLLDGSYGCLVLEPAAIMLRDRWTEAAYAEALSCATRGRWEEARVAASRAFVIERSMNPERIAMLALAHERCGNTVGAEGYVEMARRSRGDAFAQRVLDRRAELEQLVEEQAPRSRPRLANAAAIYASNDNAMRAGLRRLRRSG